MIYPIITPTMVAITVINENRVTVKYLPIRREERLAFVVSKGSKVFSPFLLPQDQ